MLPMPHIVEFYPATEAVSDSYGGINRTFPATGQTVAAFVQFISDSFAILNQTEGNNTTVNVFIPGSFDAKYYDRVKFNNEWYEVRSVIFGNGLGGVAYTKLGCGQNNQI